MSTTESDFMEVDPEMERIWREDDEPSFTELRATMNDETDVNDGTTDGDQDSVSDETVNDDVNTTDDGADNSQLDDEVDTETDTGKYKIKASDMELELSLDELRILAQKGIDYTKKTQALAPWRKQISAMQEAGLGEHDMNLMIDVLKGDKNAIAEVLKRTKVDPLEIDTDNKATYTPNQYGKDETVLAIEEVVSEISQDKEYATTARVVDDVWDSKSRELMAQNPGLIKGLHEEIKMGRYEIVAPMATKMKTMDMVRGNATKSDLEYYQMAVDNYIMTSQQTQAVDKTASKNDVADKSAARKAATSTKRTSGGKSVIDYLDDNDEDFDQWYKSTISKH